MHVSSYSEVIHIFKIKMIGPRPCFLCNEIFVPKCAIFLINSIRNSKMRFYIVLVYQTVSYDTVKGIWCNAFGTGSMIFEKIAFWRQNHILPNLFHVAIFCIIVHYKNLIFFYIWLNRIFCDVNSLKIFVYCHLNKKYKIKTCRTLVRRKRR